MTTPPVIPINKAARQAAVERINGLWKQLVREIEWSIEREAIGEQFGATHVILRSREGPEWAVGLMFATAPAPREQVHDMLGRAAAQFGRITDLEP